MGRLGGVTFIIAGVGLAAYASPWQVEEVRSLVERAVGQTQVQPAVRPETTRNTPGPVRDTAVAAAPIPAPVPRDSGEPQVSGERVFSAGNPLLVAAGRLASVSRPGAEGAAAGQTGPTAPAPTPAFRTIAPKEALGRSEASQTLVREIQKELLRIGCGQPRVTGAWDESTKTAARAFLERSNARLPLDAPDPVLHQMLKLRDAGACSTRCPQGEAMVASGRCLPRAIVASGAGDGNLPVVAPRAVAEASPASRGAIVTGSAPGRQQVAVPSNRRVFEAPISSGWQTSVSSAPASKAVDAARRGGIVAPESRGQIAGHSRPQAVAHGAVAVGSLLPPLADARGAPGQPSQKGRLSPTAEATSPKDEKLGQSFGDTPAAASSGVRVVASPAAAPETSADRRVVSAPRARRVAPPPYGLTRSSPRYSSSNRASKSGVARRRAALYNGLQFSSP
jgi:hypothetical protein